MMRSFIHREREYGRPIDRTTLFCGGGGVVVDSPKEMKCARHKTIVVVAAAAYLLLQKSDFFFLPRIASHRILHSSISKAMLSWSTHNLI